MGQSRDTEATLICVCVPNTVATPLHTLPGIMDPLGARPTILTAEDVPRWSKEPTQQKLIDPLSSSPTLFGPEADFPKAHKTPPFAIRQDLNEKMALW